MAKVIVRDYIKSFGTTALKNAILGKIRPEIGLEIIIVGCLPDMEEKNIYVVETVRSKNITIYLYIQGKDTDLSDEYMSENELSYSSAPKNYLIIENLETKARLFSDIENLRNQLCDAKKLDICDYQIPSEWSTDLLTAEGLDQYFEDFIEDIIQNKNHPIKKIIGSKLPYNIKLYQLRCFVSDVIINGNPQKYSTYLVDANIQQSYKKIIDAFNAFVI
jgi:hypothetical protein